MTAPIAAWQQAVTTAWNSLAAGQPGPPGDRDRQVRHAIDRARSAIGTQYAWGGGNKTGVTQGETDHGGDADAHGDYTHTGFDCSGLMMYAFGDNPATHVIRGSQNEYNTGGTQVPYAQREPGDMIFYGGPTSIHHVALYTGKNAQGQDMMVEAEESGTRVHEVPVRITGDLSRTVVRPIK